MSTEACVALVDKLCASNSTIKAAVVSADMFIALAKPATAGVALKLIETYGIEISDEVREFAFCCNAPPGTSLTHALTPPACAAHLSPPI